MTSCDLWLLTGIIQPIQLVDASLGYGLGKQQVSVKDKM